MKAHEGDIVEVRAPSGVEQIEVLEIRYGGARGETRGLVTFDYWSSREASLLWRSSLP